MKALGLKASRQCLKPILTGEGKHRRVNWALRFIRELPGGKCKFNPLTDMVCLDEKWLFQCVHRQKYYPYDGHIMPVRRVQHKSHVVKVMFLAAVARPRWDTHSNCHFNGLIEI